MMNPNNQFNQYNQPYPNYFNAYPIYRQRRRNSGCGLIGCGLILFFATAQAVTQLSSGDHNRGLIMGVWSMVLCGAQPLGTLIAGWAADAWGVPAVLVLQAAGIAAAGVGVLLVLRGGTTRPKHEIPCPPHPGRPAAFRDPLPRSVCRQAP